jgi:hypothetical protein
MKPNVGLTLFTSSFIIFLTIVVFPALSRPLPRVSKEHTTYRRYRQHQDSHLLVLETSFAQYRQHPGTSNFLVVTGKKERTARER